MSCNLNNIISCPNAQADLNGNFGQLSGNYREPSPLTEFIVSPANTGGFLQKQLDLGTGRKRAVELRYRSRWSENQVTDSADLSCKTGDEPGHTSKVYEIDSSIGSSTTWKYSLRDLEDACEEDALFFARSLQDAIDVLVRKINTDNWTKAATLLGKFPSTGLTTAVTVKTKNADGTYIPEALEKLRFEFLQMDYTGVPVVFGGSELFSLYFAAIGAACCNSTTGVDLNALFQQQRVVPFFDRKAETALGANYFLAIAPGALQFLTYNEFKGAKGIRVLDIDTEKQGVIVDPYTDIEFDYHAQYDCGTWYFQLKVAHDLVGLPDDIFCADDRMTGVNWVNQFLINNA